MKKYKAIINMTLCLGVLLLISCDKQDEVPPRRQESTNYKTFKMPAPEALNDADKAALDKIKDEYTSSVND